MIHLAILAVLFFCTHLVVADNPAAFWNGYPSCAVNLCLAPLTTSTGCETNDNECVCTTESFVTNVAACLGQKCPDIVYEVYQMYSAACEQNGGYTIAISSSEWAADAGSSAVSSAAPLPQTTEVEVAQPSTTPVAQPTETQPTVTQPTETQPIVTQPTTVDSAPSPSSTASSGGLTLDQKIALGVGIGIGVPTFIATVLALCLR